MELPLPIIPNLGMIVPIMGKKDISYAPPVAATALADVLFTPVQQRVLGLLFGQPARRFQSAEVIRLAGSGTGAVHRLLTRLAETGLVVVEQTRIKSAQRPCTSRNGGHHHHHAAARRARRA